MSDESIQLREPSDSERKLLAFLGSQVSSLEPGWLDELRVGEMDDGGMGSLRLLPRGISEVGRIFGQNVAEYQFVDEDDVAVIATLHLAQDGLSFELDVWKTDLSPLIRIPAIR